MSNEQRWISFITLNDLREYAVTCLLNNGKIANNRQQMLDQKIPKNSYALYISSVLYDDCPEFGAPSRVISYNIKQLREMYEKNIINILLESMIYKTLFKPRRYPKDLIIKEYIFFLKHFSDFMVVGDYKTIHELFRVYDSEALNLLVSAQLYSDNGLAFINQFP